MESKMSKAEFETQYPGVASRICDDFSRVRIREEDFPKNHLMCNTASTAQYYFRYLVSYGILDIYITEI